MKFKTKRQSLRICSLVFIVGLLVVSFLLPGMASDPIVYYDQDLVITEVCSNPKNTAYGNDVYEYVEIYNTSDHSIDLTNCHFQYGKEGYATQSWFENPMFFHSSSGILQPDEYMVIAVYGNGTAKEGCGYSNDSEIEAYLASFNSSYGSNVTLSNFGIAACYLSKNVNETYPNSIQLGNSDTNVTIRILNDSSEILVQANYDAKSYDRNNYSLQFTYVQGGYESIAAACKFVGLTDCNPGIIKPNQIYNNEFAATVTGEQTLIVEYNVNAEGYDESFMTAQEMIDTPYKLVSFRSQFYTDFINEYHPDVVGMQEVNRSWCNYFKTIPGYSFSGTSRYNNTDGYGTGNWDVYNLILFNSDKYTVLDEGTFWLSDTWYQSSSGWSDGTEYDFERTCSWVQLENKITGTSFFVFNSHYTVSPDKGVALICEKVKEIAGSSPVYILGDYSYEGNYCYNRFINEGFADPKYLALDTKFIGNYNKWGSYNVKTRTPTDYCFISPENIGVLKYTVDTQLHDGYYCSDHFPTLVYSVIKNNTPNELTLRASATTVNLADSNFTGLSNENTVETVKKYFVNSDQVSIFNKDGVLLANTDFVGTGCLIKLISGNDILDEATVIVKGDLNGDGRVLSNDYIEVLKHINGTKTLTGIYLIAADANRDSSVTSTDYSNIKSFFEGTYDLYHLYR